MTSKENRDMAGALEKIRTNLNSQKEGLQPGALIHSGEHQIFSLDMVITDYGPDHVKVTESSDLQQTLNGILDRSELSEGVTMRWVHFRGLPDAGIIEEMGKILGLHNLILEDILHTTQRPKIETHGGKRFLVLRRPFRKWHKPDHPMSNEQICLLAGPGWTISMESYPADFFNPVRERILHNRGRIRKMGSDYLIYALIDRTADSYFSIFEKITEHSAALEEAIIHSPAPEQLKQIHSMRRMMTVMRRAIWPLRDICADLIRELDTPEKTSDPNTDLIPFLRDLQDHSIRLIDSLESNRDLIAGLQDLYLATIGNKTNDIMKVLTIISTCFMPMTFIAGVYGMNFDIIPETKWPFGYYYAWAVMLAAALTMVGFLKKRKWL